MPKRARSEVVNDDWCSHCFQGGDLICCDSCHRSFHLRCAFLTNVPDGEWYCHGCQLEKSLGLRERYYHILHAARDHVFRRPSALAFCIEEVLNHYYKRDLLRLDFVVPQAERIPPLVRDENGSVDEPGYAREFAYLGFKVDPESRGEPDRWRALNFDSTAFLVSLNRLCSKYPSEEADRLRASIADKGLPTFSSRNEPSCNRDELLTGGRKPAWMQLLQQQREAAGSSSCADQTPPPTRLPFKFEFKTLDPRAALNLPFDEHGRRISLTEHLMMRQRAQLSAEGNGRLSAEGSARLSAEGTNPSTEHSPSAEEQPTQSGATTSGASDRLSAALLEERAELEIELSQRQLEKTAAEAKLAKNQADLQDVLAAQSTLEERLRVVNAMLTELRRLGFGPTSPALNLTSEAASGSHCRTICVWHPACYKHATPGVCPETATRLKAVVTELKMMENHHKGKLQVRTATGEAKNEYIELVHSAKYLAFLRLSQPKTYERPVTLAAATGSDAAGLVWGMSGARRSSRATAGQHRSTIVIDPVDHPRDETPTGDLETFLSADSMSAARHAAGAVCEAVDLVMNGKCKNAFCAVRPPGHHAGKVGMAMGAVSQGFCLINNAAIGVRYAQHTYDTIKRCAIFDFDVHHGNGTQEIFEDDPSVLFVSIHVYDEEIPFFPMTGGNSERTQSHVINLPLEPHTDKRAFRGVVLKALHAIKQFEPHFIFLSAGFDAHKDDPLGGATSSGLELREDDFSWLTSQVADLASLICGGRLVSILEGGYSPEVLRKCVRAHVTSLLLD